MKTLKRNTLTITAVTRPKSVPKRLIQDQRLREGSKKTACSDMGWWFQQSPRSGHSAAQPLPPIAVEARSMTETVIEVHDLAKSYKTSFRRPPIRALDGIDFTVRAGELFGLLGPNGAGKTTSVKILLGLTRRHRGRGAGPRTPGQRSREPASRRLPAGRAQDPGLSDRAAGAVDLRPDVGDGEERHRVAHDPELLDRVKLSQWVDVRIKKFSKGMTQRLGLACALIHSPERAAARRADRRRRSGRPPRDPRPPARRGETNGTAVLLNSHLLSEIELTCDRVAVLRNGQSGARKGPSTSSRARRAKYKMVATSIDEALVASFRETGAVVERVNGHIELSVDDVQHLNALVDRLRASGGMLTELAPLRSTLEDVFVDLIKTSEPPQ